MASDLREGWYTSGLPGLECVRQTYCLLPLTAVPSITLPTPSWSWLPATPAAVEWSIGGSSKEAADGFLDAAAKAGLVLPAAFLDFVRRPDLGNAIRSGTGCWWTLGPDSIATTPDGLLPAVRFLNDQQDVLFWYLLIDGSSEPPVVVSYQDFSDLTFEPGPPNDVWRCASGFEEFMYRFWLENEISFRSRAGQTLDQLQTAYLREARRLGALEGRAHVSFGDAD